MRLERDQVAHDVARPPSIAVSRSIRSTGIGASGEMRSTGRRRSGRASRRRRTTRGLGRAGARTRRARRNLSCAAAPPSGASGSCGFSGRAREHILKSRCNCVNIEGPPRVVQRFRPHRDAQIGVAGEAVGRREEGGGIAGGDRQPTAAARDDARREVVGRDRQQQRPPGAEIGSTSPPTRPRCSAWPRRVWQHAGLASATSSALVKLKAAGLDVDREALDALQPRVVADEPAFNDMWEMASAAPRCGSATGAQARKRSSSGTSSPGAW